MFILILSQAIHVNLLAQRTPAVKRLQVSVRISPQGEWPQFFSEDSSPPQWTLSNQICWEDCVGKVFAARAFPHPSSLQTTLALSLVFQDLSPQTIPHWLLWRTSTIPAQRFVPFTSLMFAKAGETAERWRLHGWCESKLYIHCSVCSYL